jgi:hypothetical protein
MPPKIDPKKVKEEFDALDDDDKASILKALGVKKADDDGDVTTTLKDVLSRLDKLEKKEPAKKGFWG